MLISCRQLFYFFKKSFKKGVDITRNACYLITIRNKETTYRADQAKQTVRKKREVIK
nr:MAG TPA: hypothetical protein [Caudoviricetes sp.]